MSNVKIGVIGAGVLGSFHLQKCVKSNEVECVGFFDVSEKRREEVSAKLGVAGFSDPEKLIEQCDGVIVATPSTTHVAMARLCLQKKRHVLVEKPLAPSHAEGLGLVELANNNNCVLHVGHSESYNAAFVQLLAYAPHPRFVEIHRLAQFSVRGTDVPVVLDLMVHDIQLLLRLCHSEPDYKNIMATGVAVVSDDIDIANVRIPFLSGCVANITASRISTKRMRKVRLFERDNYYSIDLNDGDIEHYVLNRGANGKPAPVASPAMQGLPIVFDCKTATPVDALEAELAAFVSAIRGTDMDCGVQGEEALKVLKVTDTIMELIGKNPVM
jgi:predicted dehydrogenase